MCKECAKKISDKLQQPIVPSVTRTIDKPVSPILNDVINKYLSSKRMDLRILILTIPKQELQSYMGDNVESLYSVSGEKIESIIDDIICEYGAEVTKTNDLMRKGKQTNLKEYEKLSYVKEACEERIGVLKDIEKIRKLLEKQGVETRNIDLIRIIVKKIIEELKNTYKKEYSRLLNDAKVMIKSGENPGIELKIKEYLIKNNDRLERLLKELPITAICLMLDEDLGMKLNWEQIATIVYEYDEDLDLLAFEKSLGQKDTGINLSECKDGYQFENRLKQLFQALGYSVTQTPFSGDQGADLIVEKEGVKAVIQAKHYKGNVPNKAIQEVAAARNHYKTELAIVVTTGKFTKSAIELSRSNNVELWDKNKLKEVISRVMK